MTTPLISADELRQPVTDAELEDADLANALVTLHREEWSVYGVRKLYRAARHAGLDIGRDQVARLMRIAGIRGVVRGRHHTTTTRPDRGAPRHPDLVGRQWNAPEAVDELWVADFSYVWTLSGFVYVAFVVDVYSRRILGWRVSGSMRTQLVLDAFRQALHLRHRGDAHWTSQGLIHHSDAGSQFTSVAFTAELLEAGIAGSIGTVVTPSTTALRVHHRAVQDRGHRRRRAHLDRPLRGGVAGRPLGPLVQHPTSSLIDRLPATD